LHAPPIDHPLSGYRHRSPRATQIRCILFPPSSCVTLSGFFSFAVLFLRNFPLPLACCILQSALPSRAKLVCLKQHFDNIGIQVAA
jgi:hypothetical protein